MDVDGQTEYFYRLYYKTKTDQTKQPSSPVDETTPFYFFKVLSIFNTQWQCSRSAWPSQKTRGVFREALVPLAGGAELHRDGRVTSLVAETCPRAAYETRSVKQAKWTAGPGATFRCAFPSEPQRRRR